MTEPLPHYDCQKIEPIEYVGLTFTPEEVKGFLKGNIIKYVSRAAHKNGLEDYKKARVYIDWLIEYMETGKITRLSEKKVITMFGGSQKEIDARIKHLEQWETEFRKNELWKKKYDSRCPSCGGLLINLGGGIYPGDDHLKECLYCLKQFVAGDTEIKPVDITDPKYIEYLKERKRLDDTLGFYNIETIITKKEIISVVGVHDLHRLTLRESVNGTNEFYIAWAVLHELGNRTGSLIWDSPEYESIIATTFDAIKLNEQYTIQIHFDKPEKQSYWNRICGKKQKMWHPYICRIKGLKLEANRIGKDFRVIKKDEL